jgi:DNA repair exonuclease SbcCD nuclease subunit
MKFLITGDWHYTDKTPTCRIDDYPTVLKNKIKATVNFAKRDGVTAILQPGDLTDTPFLNYSAYRELYSLLDCGIPIYTVYGQHDLRYRNRGNTPLDALQDSLDSFQVSKKANFGNVYIHSVSYGEEIPKPKLDVFNILLIHKMIINVPEAEWQEDYDLGIDFLTKSKYDLVVSGDNHKSFMVKHKKQHLFNCGSLMRSTIDQIDHQPCFYSFDTDTRTYEQYCLPITRWQTTFDLEKKVKEEERNEHMESFVSGLSGHKDMGLNFEDNLYMYLKKNKIDDVVVDIIKRNMEGVK